jgi:hypothetical protein
MQPKRFGNMPALILHKTCMKKLLLMALILGAALQIKAQDYKTNNIVIVTIDGLRWQEVFRGADSTLIKSKYTDNKPAVEKQYWTKDEGTRRQILFPFLWSTVVRKGQLYGNRDAGNRDEVANRYFFSYPGYSELFTGFADPRMNSNNAISNPNTNVFEFLNKQKGLENKVAVFSSWERFTQILMPKRSGLMVNAGYMDLTNPNLNDHLHSLNQLQHKVPHYLGDSTRTDSMTYAIAREYMKQYQPRVMYLAFDETDEFAHQGKHNLYLEHAHQADQFIKQLWDDIQSNPFYKDKTTLIITCDHGRGDTNADTWRNHGMIIAPHSEQTWFAVMGPDTPAMGEMGPGNTTYHKQLAQTIAGLLGFDFKAAAGHEVADPIRSVTRVPRDLVSR